MALGEYKLRKYLHERVKRPTSEYEDEEMEANTDIYAEFIISTVERIKETCPHPLVMVEERLDYSYLVPSGFGTGRLRDHRRRYALCHGLQERQTFSESATRLFRLCSIRRSPSISRRTLHSTSSNASAGITS